MRRMEATLQRLYAGLLELHGPQGWWPIPSLRGRKGVDGRGYHPGCYDYPETEGQRFEVILGAILTQNTTWTNAERALGVLRERRLLGRKELAACGVSKLAELIRASRYFQQKAKKIKAMLTFLDSRQDMTRENLLGVWGVGPETADSILLYACHEPFFVVDAYTKRILEYLRIVREGASYDEIQALFHASLPPDPPLLNEYHALFVAHAKRFYSKKPYGLGDPLVSFRRKRSPRGGR